MHSNQQQACLASIGTNTAHATPDQLTQVAHTRQAYIPNITSTTSAKTQSTTASIHAEQSKTAHVSCQQTQRDMTSNGLTPRTLHRANVHKSCTHSKHTTLSNTTRERTTTRKHHPFMKVVPGPHVKHIPSKTNISV